MTKTATPVNPWDEGNWESAGSLIWKPEAGDSLTGVLEGFEVFTEGTLGQQCMKYYILTQEGLRFSMVGGQSFDKVIEQSKVVNGDLLRLQYLGKKDLADGKKVNLWDVKFKKAGDKPFVVPTVPAGAISSDEPPF